MDFKEQKLKEFREQFYQYWDSFDQTSTCERVESFLRKTLEEQEKDFDKTMEIYHDNYFELKRRLNKEHKKVIQEQEKRLRLSEKEVFNLITKQVGKDLKFSKRYFLTKSIIVLQDNEKS